MDHIPDELLSEVEAFLSETGMPATIFGRQEMNDASFVPDLRAGRECRRSTRERARAAMQRLREGIKGNGKDT
jgi:hypothetical protein